MSKPQFIAELLDGREVLVNLNNIKVADNLRFMNVEVQETNPRQTPTKPFFVSHKELHLEAGYRDIVKKTFNLAVIEAKKIAKKVKPECRRNNTMRVVK